VTGWLLDTNVVSTTAHDIEADNRKYCSKYQNVINGLENEAETHARTLNVSK
jgi:hypothetical protein